MYGQTAIRLDDLLAGLSAALDLVEGQPLGHAGRSALIALRLGDRVGVSDTDRDVLLYATLLKDAGCSSNAARIAALFGADDRWIKADRARLARREALPAARSGARPRPAPAPAPAPPGRAPRRCAGRAAWRASCATSATRPRSWRICA